MPAGAIDGVRSTSAVGLAVQETYRGALFHPNRSRIVGLPRCSLSIDQDTNHGPLLAAVDRASECHFSAARNDFDLGDIVAGTENLCLAAVQVMPHTWPAGQRTSVWLSR